MYIALRKGDHDIVFCKKVADAVTNIAANLTEEFLARHVAPEVGVKHQGVIAEVLKDRIGRRVFLDLRVKVRPGWREDAPLLDRLEIEG